MIAGVVQKLCEHAKHRPGAPALSDDGRVLTYGELLKRVEAVHRLLRRHGAAPGTRVAICADNSIEHVVAALGILHAGCAFIPLPFRDPEARLRRLCAKAKPAVVFLGRRGDIADIASAVDIADVLGSAASGGDGPPPAARMSDDLAYIIFTSGSTGEPKGVCVSTGSFAYAVQAAGLQLDFAPETRSLVILPLHFDASFSSVFPVLMFGGRVHVHRGPLCTPADFFAQFDAQKITHTTTTPTYLKALVNAEEWASFDGGSWRTLATGGESPPRAVLRRIIDRFPSLRVFNRYGPTEATMAVCTHELSHELIRSDAPFPIGRPHRGVVFALLDADGLPVPPGQAGELYIGGVQLMSGYLDDAETTRTVLGPIVTGGAPFLKTGDMVTTNAAGEYVYIERVDNVVKRNGMRIALAEVEAALVSLEDVKAAVCVDVPAADAKIIVAFVVPARADVRERELRRALLRVLPATMMPDVIHFTDDAPMTSGGKTDRRAMRAAAGEIVARLSAPQAATP